MAMENPEDLATLSQLEEGTLLDSLIARFQKKQIYTYIGDILVAMNPFKDLPLYDKQVSEKYKNHEKGQLPPHIFAVADRAYQSMQGRLATGPRNQCIVISGESGAGKTESTKLLLRQIMELCRGNAQLEQQVLQVNPLLEAFGNAQTVMNDNSSRFGKYIQLRFLNNCVKGAKINEYLLEKSRVVHQDDGERNFHIFYCMFAGISASDKEMYGLLEPALYRYINHKYGSEEMVQHWSMKYWGMCNAMNMVGFEEQEQVDMMTILAGILSLGNIEFEPHDSGGLKVTPGSLGWLKAAAGQFGVQEEELQKCLICTMSVTRGESIQRHHTQQQAEDARDSIAKVVYGRVFGWIVSKINELLAPNVDDNVELLEIGILDIFGFENFAVNRFEQLCINLANEQLQYFFNHHIFLMEQREYKEEGLPWEMITFKDNKPILDLFLVKPAGIMCILDEQTAFPQATDRAFVEKLSNSFKGNNYFQIGRSINPVFTVVHYAGKVQYTASGFLEKNRDTIPANIRTLFINSITPLLSVLFAATISRTGTLMPQRKSRHMQVLEDNFNTTRKQSVGAQFRHSLMVLMEKMFAASPHFVRCIKPNRCKLPDMVDNHLVMDQLRYNGLLETIRIRRDGFSWRPSFDEFANRYNILLVKSELPPTRESCEAILHATNLKGWNIGKSRLFFKYWHKEQLAKCVNRLDQAAVIIQKWYKGFRCQRIYRVLVAEMLKERELEREREMELERERVKERELERVREEQHQMELEQERKRQLEQENQEHIAAPVPLPRKKKPQPQPRLHPHASDMAVPPVPRPRSKLIEATPFDNALDHIAKKEEARQREMKRTATIRWFKETQMRKVARNGTFPNWFHGMISRREAENLLADKPLGCFLIRVSQNREGYTLTFKGDNRCKHYMIEVQTNGKYVILGEDQAHASLPDLVEYHKNVGIKPYMELLTVPCGQKSDKESDYEELTHLMKHPVQNNGACRDLGHLSGEQRVHLQLSQMFVPLQPGNITVAERPPILKKISDKKLGSPMKELVKTSPQHFSDEENQGHRAIPRLYPSIRLAMREIQQIRKQVQFSFAETPDSRELGNP